MISIGDQVVYSKRFLDATAEFSEKAISVEMKDARGTVKDLRPCEPNNSGYLMPNENYSGMVAEVEWNTADHPRWMHETNLTKVD